MRKLQILMLTLFTTTAAAFGQRVMLDGYVFEESNRGFLNEVKVTVLEKTGVYVGETISDITGHFAIEIDGGKNYDVQFEKKIFKIEHTDLSTIGKTAGETVFLKQQMQRLPGYLLEVTLAEKRFNESVNVDAVNGARIEIYNLTKNRAELVIDSARSPVFSLTLQQGNHYVLMVRKKGFFTKRMDAHVNVDGCYLCMEGFGTVNPGVVSNLTSSRNNQIGTLLSNVELERIDTNRNIVIKDIYYAYNSAELTENARKELDKVVSLMRNNGSLVIELGSHTDSRGSEEANMKLSDARARSAVQYILASGWVQNFRIKARGYGENRLVNRCADGVPCSEEEHLKNRRTELKIIGFTVDQNEDKSLAEIIHAEEMMKFVSTAGTFEQEYKATTATPAAPTNPTASVNGKQIEPSKSNVSMQQLESQPMNVPTKPTTYAEPPLVNTPKINVSMAQLEAQQPMPQQTNPSVNSTLQTPVSKQKIDLSAIDAKFSGYKIELFTSPVEQSVESMTLQQIAANVTPEISFDRLPNGQFSYLVGTFLGWGETERFLEKVIAKFPSARIVEFFNGKRI